MSTTMRERDTLGSMDELEKNARGRIIEALNFTLKETANLVNVPVPTLRREAKLGRIRSVRVGRFVRIPRAEVLRLVGWEAEAE
jgi:excisionase family DNA binding protein